MFVISFVSLPIQDLEVQSLKVYLVLKRQWKTNFLQTFPWFFSYDYFVGGGGKLVFHSVNQQEMTECVIQHLPLLQR